MSFHINGFKTVIFFIGLVPAIILVYGVVMDSLGANPVEVLTRDSGLWALRFLLLTLTVSPLSLLTGWHRLMSVRRMLGLYCFFYASMHMILYLWLDQFFVIEDIVSDVMQRPFIAVGFISFLILLLLALSSHRLVVSFLGSEKWKSLHRWIYPTSIAAVIHFWLLVKQDLTEPIYYALLLALLLGFRVYRYLKVYFSYQ